MLRSLYEAAFFILIYFSCGWVDGSTRTRVVSAYFLNSADLRVFLTCLRRQAPKFGWFAMTGDESLLGPTTVRLRDILNSFGIYRANERSDLFFESLFHFFKHKESFFFVFNNRLSLSIGSQI